MGIFVVTVLLLIAIHSCHGNHFRGGSMSWKPVGNNQIELMYRVGFIYYHTETGFDPCTINAQYYRTVLKTSGKIKCDSCSEEDQTKKLDWICDDYDMSEDSAIGHNKKYYTIPEGQNEFTISHEHCCWVNLQSPINPNEGGARGWMMMTNVNVTLRPDGGGINSSPVSAPIPVEKFYKGCMYHLQIPVSDPDNDAIRCRYADMDKNECPSKGYSKACGVPTDGLKINKKDCTLDFDTTNVDEGYHAVNVMIEDYIRPVKRKSKPLSGVPLLFLLFVDGESTTCAKPSFVDPPSCKTVRPGEMFNMVLRADPGDPAKPISKIKTQKPYGMLASEMENDPEVTNRKKVTLSWDTTDDDIGEYSVCYSALDYDSYTSGVTCTFLYVDDNPLRPDPQTSLPPPGAEIEVEKTWVVEFNKQIRRPKESAFIRIVEPFTGDVAYEIDASDKEVVFNERNIEFTPPREALLNGDSSVKTQYELRLEEGVAMTKAGGCGSEAVKWLLAVKDVQSIGITTPTMGPPPSLDCTTPTMEIFVPNETAPVGEDCFLSVDDDTVMMSYGEEGVTAPYTLCCPGSCVNVDVGPPGPPAGPPGMQV